MLLTAVLGAGLVGGAGIAWLSGQLRPSVYTRRRLEELTNLPVLGSTSMVWSRRERSRRVFGVSIYVVHVLALFGAYAYLMLDYLPPEVRDVLRSLKETVT